MEICQSCGVKFAKDRTQHVEFAIWDVIDRYWIMCPNCADKLQDMVLGFMGELPPGDDVVENQEPEVDVCSQCGTALGFVEDVES